MLNLGFDAFATFIVIVAPIAIVLFLIVLVVAYPWLLLIPLAIWYLSIKHSPGELPGPWKDSENSPESGEADGWRATESATADKTVPL